VTDVGERNGPDGDRSDQDRPVADVVHELNNSLASIVAFSQLIRTDPDLPPKLHQQADLLIQEANRVRSIVQRLLEAGQRPAEPVSSAGAVKPTSPALAVAGADRPTRVLVLDDEAAIREFLARVLRRGGYEPVLAASGDAALAAIDEARPDAILCDHRMAGMTGTEFHEAVAARDPDLARRIAFMSGDVMNPDLREFADREGVLLLAKPFDIASVAKTVETLLAREAG
jgi:CheY-like chemotaxis protein